MNRRSRLLMTIASLPLLAGALAGCKSKGDIVVDEGVGITAIRGACPAVGIADYTGDITVFRTPGSTLASDIDLTAAMTNVRNQCDPSGAKVVDTVSFTVEARRTDNRGARTVSLPWFVTVVRGGNAVTAKRIGTVTIQFADGQERAQATGTGTAFIDKAEATLSSEVRNRITRKRKAGDFDAAIDPLAQPDVRAAVDRATFDVFVGFQLDTTQVEYNATR
jgi:hypothetical protein